jgi:hypothetical protein
MIAQIIRRKVIDLTAIYRIRDDLEPQAKVNSPNMAKKYTSVNDRPHQKLH